MPIPISCPKCGRKYRVRDELAGKVAKCQCGNSITIPEVPIAPPQAVPAAPLDTSTDLFAGISEEAMSQSSPLQPLAPRGKRRRKKGISPLLILAVAGGSVVALLIVVVVIISLLGGDSPPVATSAGLTEAPASNVRWATPEAVFEARKKATQQKDWKTLYETRTPGSQNKVNATLAAMTVILAPVIPELQTIRTEYKIDTVQPSVAELMQLQADPKAQKKLRARYQAAVENIPDKLQFFTRVMESMAKAIENDQTGNLRQMKQLFEADATAKLSDLKVTGDKATGKCTNTLMGQTKVELLEFVKIDGEWRIEELSL